MVLQRIEVLDLLRFESFLDELKVLDEASRQAVFHEESSAFRGRLSGRSRPVEMMADCGLMKVGDGGSIRGRVSVGRKRLK